MAGMDTPAPLLIAQISDAHVGTGRDFLDGRIDTTRSLERAVQHLLALDPSPDVVLFTGDMAEFGRPRDYATIAAALAPLSMPVLAVPGNHDDPLAARAALPACMPVDVDAPAGTCCLHVRQGGLHLVGLDTVVPGQSHGEIGEAQLQWLGRCLERCRDEPVLVFMHHPPIAVGIVAMDDCRLLEGAEALAALIRRHGAVQGVLCGHLHRPVQATFGGAPLHVAPSVSHQIALDLRRDAPLAARLEPPKVSLHRWSAASGLCSHLSYVEPFGERFPI